MIRKIYPIKAVVEHGGSRAAIAWTLFPVVVPAEMVTAIVTDP